MTREVRLVCEKIGVCEELKELLPDGFVCYFADSNVEFERHANWLHPLIRSQDDIGWEQLFYGRFSKQWAAIHEERLRLKGVETNERNSGKTLTRRLMLKIWTLVHGVWKERNLARHGETEQEQREKKREQCLAELKMWCELGDQGKQSLAKTKEEEIFFATVEEHHNKEGSLARVQRWLCTFGSALLQSKLSAAIAKRRAARNN